MSYQPLCNPMPVSGTVSVNGTIPMSGTFWQATQPVSLANLPPLASGSNVIGGVTQSGTWNVTVSNASLAVTGAFYQATQPVSIASMPSTPVTGTFWPATQPVSIAATVGVSGPLTDTQLRATAVPVSGSFYPPTQPVSIASMPTTPVTGTFFQSTQPVSIATMPSTPVTGTFFQATQPVSIAATVAVSGPLTDTQLRAASVPVSIASMPSTPVTGTFWQATQPVSLASLPMDEVLATFRGRVATFRTPGRAGTTGQKILALHNATGSTKIVHVNQITVDCLQTAVIAVTVLPPIIRIYRFTAVPTNGTVLTKAAKDTALSSNASVTAWGDASADGTGSATTLTVTLGAAITQEFAPRLITAAGYEMFDRTEMLAGFDVVLRPLEGICVMLDYTVATANPTTTHWTATADWYEL